MLNGGVTKDLLELTNQIGVRAVARLQTGKVAYKGLGAVNGAALAMGLVGECHALRGIYLYVGREQTCIPQGSAAVCERGLPNQSSLYTGCQRCWERGT